MEGMVRSGGEATQITRNSTPAVATAYYLTVFKPTHPDMGLRNSREARTLCCALDHLARGEYGETADLLSQRLKALEKAQKDGNSWRQAQWLELLPPEGMTLVERDEEYMATREEELCWRIHGGKGSWGGKDYKNKDAKGKGKDDKGKGKWKDSKGKGKGQDSY